MSRRPKLIITAALVGAEVTRDQQPNLPLTPEEIAAEAVEAADAGASVIHLHVRDAAGEPTQDPETFGRTIRLIRQSFRRPALCPVIQVSTGGAIGMTAEERMAPLTLTGTARPEMATLSAGSVNFGDDVFLNPPELIERLAVGMRRAGIKPEIEVFDVGMIQTGIELADKGLVDPPLHFDLVMGVPGGIPGTPKNLLHLVESLPAGSTWSVAGIGRAELELGTIAIILGGHVRVGFEDNIFYKRGVLADSNAQLAARIARISGELGREVAAPAEARRILGLPGKD